MSSQDSRGGGGASLRDRRVARVIDREIAPIWHDRFARLIVRNLPGSSDVIALDIHCGVGRTTAELLARLGPAARVLAIEPDDTLIEMAKTRMRPEWKNRVYLKPGNFDDVAGMADDSYNLVVANLVLGDTGDIGTALAEMIRVNRIGGRILATLPLADSWHEVEDIFAEVLRDAGLTAAVRRLERLRELRPTGPQLAQMVRGLGVAEDDFVIEQERFQMLFPSGREFLFAPVVEHGPLRLWKAVIGKDGSPQELFWRLKEAIDIYYTGHVLAVNVMAGLMNITVAKGTESPGPRLAARYWRHYPGLDALWGGLAAGYVRVSEPSLPPLSDFEFDFDIQIDDGEARRTGAHKPVTTSSIPIATDDLDDIPASPAIPAVAAKAVRAEAGSGRRTEPAKPLAALNNAPKLARPPVAEDDFSDINEPPDPTANFAKQRPQPPPDPAAAVEEPEEPEESSDPTSTFSPDELRAARTSQPLPRAPAPEPAEAEPEATQPEPELATEPVAEPEVAAATTEPEPTEPSGPSEPPRLPVRTPIQDSGAFRRPSPGEPSALPAFRPPTSDSGNFKPPTAAEPNTRPSEPFRPPGDSGTTFRRPPAPESSGLTRPPASSESSGFTRPPASPSSESSGFTRPPTSPSSESSGFTRLPASPSSEGSGFTRPPAFLRPNQASPAATATGSFNVFAPPKPRLSEETAASHDEPASETPTATTATSPAPATPDDEPPSTLSAALADLADLTATSAPASDRPDEPTDADEPEELDELEEADELEEDEPVARAAPPPRPKAPPPPPSNLFKPRPLLPIVPPKKK